MRKDAEAHAEEDKKRREEIEQRNEADNAVYRSEKMLKDNADKISGSDKSKIEDAVAEVKEALKGSDAAAIKLREREAATKPGRRFAPSFTKRPRPRRRRGKPRGPAPDGEHRAVRRETTRRQERPTA